MLKAIIVDDEQHCIDSLENLINEYCSEIEITGKYNCPVKALPAIIETKPDILFLDVDMPKMTGVELAKSLPISSTDVVFITAYNKYAYDAFKTNAIDFILKPVNIVELITAVNKVSERRKKAEFDNLKFQNFFDSYEQTKNPKVGIPTSKGIEYVNKSDIIWAEASSSYCEIHLSDKRKLTVSKPLGDIEKLLNDKIFFRLHKSHLINLHYVVRYNIKDGGQVELSDKTTLLLARRKKDEFIEAMTNLSD